MTIIHFNTGGAKIIKSPAPLPQNSVISENVQLGMKEIASPFFPRKEKKKKKR